MPTNLPHFHYHTDILAADPISYIKMNEVSGTALADSSGRGRPAVINSTSGIHYDRTGIPGTQDDTCITLTGTGHTNVISWGTDTGLAADIGHITVWWRNTCPMASLPSQQVILDIAGQFSFYLDTDGAHVHTNAGSNNDSHLGNTLDLVRPFDWGSWNFVVIEWNINEGIFATINSNLLLALNWDHTNWATGNAITLLKNISLPSGEIGVANGAIYNDSGFSNFYQEQWIEGSAISETTRFLDNPNSSYPGMILADEPIGYWRYNDSEASVAATGEIVNFASHPNGRNALMKTTVNAVFRTWAPIGCGGYAISGVQYDIPGPFINLIHEEALCTDRFNDPAVHCLNAYSLEGWFRVSDQGINYVQVSMFSSVGTGTIEVGRLAGDQPGTVFSPHQGWGKVVYVGPVGDTVAFATWEQWMDNQWHHVAVTVDTYTQERKRYFDGVHISAQDDTNAFYMTLPNNSINSFALGIQGFGGWGGLGQPNDDGRDFAGTNFFQEVINCALCELAVYNYALSDAQIARHYSMGISAVPTQKLLAPLPCHVRVSIGGQNNGIAGGVSVTGDALTNYADIIKQDRPYGWWRLNDVLPYAPFNEARWGYLFDSSPFTLYDLPDSSGNGHNGIWFDIGGLETGVPGIAGDRGLTATRIHSFDGSNSPTFYGSEDADNGHAKAMLTLETEFPNVGSIEFWFKSTAASTSRSGWLMWGGAQLYILYFQPGMAVFPGGTNLAVHTPPVTHHDPYIQLNDFYHVGQQMNDDIWHHVVVTWDVTATTFKAYRDGVYYGSMGWYPSGGLNTSSIGVTDDSLHLFDYAAIGTDSQYSHDIFIGEAAEYAMYRYELTQDQVSNHYAHGFQWLMVHHPSPLTVHATLDSLVSGAHDAVWPEQMDTTTEFSGYLLGGRRPFTRNSIFKYGQVSGSMSVPPEDYQEVSLLQEKDKTSRLSETISSRGGGITTLPLQPGQSFNVWQQSGRLCRVQCAGSGYTGTITVYDGLDNTGPVIFGPMTPANHTTYSCDIPVSDGIYAVNATNGIVTITFDEQ